ncbi:GAS domain-containing protein [Microvirga rosea]|uniref:hypothetical protein n=1 Tax=Microvirga rosea TaxID=2715425 RepID=UPI001D0B1FD8|nr:hypothetical protein [Microvirga rosea]MCB8820159.1 hypothetical protein [Microvirga rosea]
MRVLILHDLPSPAILRRALGNQTLFYPKYRPDTEVTLHGVGDPLNDSIVNGEYDAIFLDVSFLCWRWTRTHITFEDFIEKYSWVATSSAPKLAFPQDDYDHHQVLDDWLSEWNVDAVFTPLASHGNVLFPKMASKALIEPFQTGFVDDADIRQSEKFNIPLAQRSMDVVYRARLLPAKFGCLGRLKSLVAEVFAPKLLDAGFKIDISTDPEKTIFGDRWLDFLGSSRFVLGSPSGSSVLDPVGEIGQRIDRYIADHPQADFDEVYRACVPDSAALHWMAAISPRVMEAGLTRTCQVLVRGEYGPMEAEKHYIPIEPDFSNLDAVMEQMRDIAEAQRIADRCYDLMTTSKDLHYRHTADRVDDVINRIRIAQGKPAIQRNSDIDCELLMERQLAARLSDKHEAIAGMAEQLGAVTGGPITVARFSELTYVVEDRWRRLYRAFDEASVRYQTLSSQVDSIIREGTNLRQAHQSLEQKYHALSAEYEALYTRPRVLIARLLELAKSVLLKRINRTN